jgi:RNA polymerase sigma-70 factor (ECF subfamily)
VSTEEPPEIRELVDRLAAEGQEPLGELFTHYRERLRRMVHYRLDRRLQGRVSPSDVLQEAYIDAVTRIPHYLEKREAMSFFVWLRLLVKQRLIGVHRQHLGARKRDAAQEVTFDYGSPDATSVGLANHLAASLSSPSQVLMHAELVDRLERALRVLGPLDCEILAMRHLEELGNDATAEILGLKKAAASNRYVRALKRLREVLAEVSEYRTGKRSDDGRTE